MKDRRARSEASPTLLRAQDPCPTSPLLAEPRSSTRALAAAPAAGGRGEPGGIRVGMLRAASIVGAVVVAVGVPMSAFAAPSCSPARISPTQPALPLAWQRALDDLAFVAAGTGQPWDCSGAELRLSPNARGAELSVRLPDGRTAKRPVAVPDLVVPVGEALLAQPDGLDSKPVALEEGASKETPKPEAPRPAAAPSAASADTAADAKAPASGARASSGDEEPRLMADVGATARVSAAVNAIWTGGVVRVTVPYDAWFGAAWARIDLPAKVLQNVSPLFTMHEVCVGVAVGHRLLRRPFDLRVAGDASFGVISMDEGNERKEKNESGEGSKADFRVGADLQAAVPFATVGRFFVGADFEITPARFGGARTITPTLPELPGFSAGLTTGLGVGIP